MDVETEEDAMKVKAIVLTGLVLATCAACGDGNNQVKQKAAAPAPAKVSWTATDSDFDVPESLESEPVEVTFSNEGSQRHEAVLLKLHDNVTPDQVIKTMSTKGPEAALQLGDLAGGFDRTRPGGSQELLMQFGEGRYMLFDQQLFMKEKIAPSFEVLPASGPEVSTPDPDVEIRLDEFDIESPSVIPSGPITIRIANEGAQTHEWAVVPKGEKENLEFGVHPLGPGITVWAEVDLAPGKYKAICMLPDTETGKSHASMGMKRPFVVE
jgi:hypothetical protein